MNSNEKILRLQKASHVVSIVLTVIRVLLVLAALGVILAGIFCGAAFTEALNGCSAPWPRMPLLPAC